MKYISTRGNSPKIDFAQACLRGLAPDGGLYVPEAWPQISPPQPQETYAAFAARLLGAFAGDAIPTDVLCSISEKAYGSFAHAAVTPLSQIGRQDYILELYHGPTLAFKDVAMQILGGLFEYILDQQEKTATILCATSGDTGGAAAYAFARRAGVKLVILHPDNRVSPVQRQFMTTTGADNIHNFAVDGDFDSCQAIVKSLFADDAFRNSVSLSGVNSINWVRIAAQSVYYAMTQASFGGDRPVRFIVPTGNMGDAFAGYVAWKCGLLPALDIHCALNANDGMTALWESGTMSRPRAKPTPSPAMDISVPSNLERLIFEIMGRDGAACQTAYRAFASTGELRLTPAQHDALSTLGITAQGVSDVDTLTEIKHLREQTGRLFCPHTAVGTFALRQMVGGDRPNVCLATADAAKFPETVEAVTGAKPVLPHHVADLSARDEVFTLLPDSLSEVRAAILAL